MKINIKILLLAVFLSAGFFAIPGIIEALVCGCINCGTACVGSSDCDMICCEGGDCDWDCWWDEVCTGGTDTDGDGMIDWDCEDVWKCVWECDCNGLYTFSHYGSCTDCGVSTCGPWSYYCSGDTVRRERDCVDRGCGDH